MYTYLILNSNNRYVGTEVLANPAENYFPEEYCNTLLPWKNQTLPELGSVYDQKTGTFVEYVEKPTSAKERSVYFKTTRDNMMNLVTWMSERYFTQKDLVATGVMKEQDMSWSNDKAAQFFMWQEELRMYPNKSEDVFESPITWPVVPDFVYTEASQEFKNIYDNLSTME